MKLSRKQRKTLKAKGQLDDYTEKHQVLNSQESIITEITPTPIEIPDTTQTNAPIQDSSQSDKSLLVIKKDFITITIVATIILTTLLVLNFADEKTELLAKYGEKLAYKMNIQL